MSLPISLNAGDGDGVDFVGGLDAGAPDLDAIFGQEVTVSGYGATASFPQVASKTAV